MVDEVAQGLQLKSGGIWMDCTVGDGGHSSRILGKTAPDGQLIGLDKDEQGLRVARGILSPFEGRFELVQGSYASMLEVLDKQDSDRTGMVDGILFDLGISSRQVEETGYGLSFNKSENLDMRLDKSEYLTAMDVVNEYEYEELCRIFKDYGEERYSKRIERKIIMESIKNVIDVLEFDDADTTCIDGINKAIIKYPNQKIKFANGGDRHDKSTPETAFCNKNNVDTLWGIGGNDKLNSSSWILKKWEKK